VLTPSSLENAASALKTFGLDSVAFEKAVEAVKLNMEK